MQENIGELIRDFIVKEDSKFLEIQGGSFIQSETGEFITKSEHDKIIQTKLEKFKTEMFATANYVSNTEFGIENEQSLTKKKSSKKKKNGKARENFDNGDFNIIYRNKVEEVMNMKLTTNEKLVFYVMRDFIQYPTNCIVINDHIPTIKELEPIIGLTERSIITALVSLEKKNMLKRVQYGHKKAIYINPDYCASGKELDVDTLALFGLAKVDDKKVESYL
jgi:ribosomal protein S25